MKFSVVKISGEYYKTGFFVRIEDKLVIITVGTSGNDHLGDCVMKAFGRIEVPYSKSGFVGHHEDGTAIQVIPVDFEPEGSNFQPIELGLPENTTQTFLPGFNGISSYGVKHKLLNFGFEAADVNKRIEECLPGLFSIAVGVTDDSVVNKFGSIGHTMASFG
eukprot:TRINITY_DN13653_c0_g1_i1.p1 TRINITY_DN13653_c0_g1~~TRINITY_DN13653_c0_g1_i1.p1  ORF type:complete len:162 (-),score=38.27 TRINITY_DN13653_c0_g1_i1:445-930(-)